MQVQAYGMCLAIQTTVLPATTTAHRYALSLHPTPAATAAVPDQAEAEAQPQYVNFNF